MRQSANLPKIQDQIKFKWYQVIEFVRCASAQAWNEQINFNSVAYCHNTSQYNMSASGQRLVLQLVTRLHNQVKLSCTLMQLVSVLLF